MNSFFEGDIPALYDLRFENTSLLIDIHRQALEFLTNMLKKDSPLIVELQKELQIPNFVLPGNNKTWGFGRVLQKQLNSPRGDNARNPASKGGMTKQSRRRKNKP